MHLKLPINFILLLLFSHSAVSDSATPWTVAQPGSTVHGISQAEILEWVVIPYYSPWKSGHLTKIYSRIAPHSEKAMAPHSSTLAWRIPWTEEPDWLWSMGLLRVGHDWENSLSLFTFMHWRRKWQLTPVFLPGESQGQRSLLDCRLWGRTESDTTDVT